MIKPLAERDDVDKEHVIKMCDCKVEIYFLKESKGDALERVKDMLIDCFVERISKSESDMQ